jgi:magnesium and cobalt transporter
MADAAPDRRPPGWEGPLHGLLNWLRQLRGPRGDDAPQSLRDELEELIEEHNEEQPIDPHERALLVNILKLHDLAAADVMVPRGDIVALDVETSFAEATRQMIEQGHSRVPLYRETLDDVLGFLHIKDLLPYTVDGRTVALSAIARKVLFVAPSMPVLDLLLQMRLIRVHLAIVVDEFGGTDGLVTIEDVIEEIVGEIEDEHDEADRPKLLARADGAVLASGRALIDALQERVAAPLVPPGFEENVTTLGGLVVALAGKVPARGEVIHHPAGFDFEVLDADPRRVKRLRIKNLPAPDDAGGGTA